MIDNSYPMISGYRLLRVIGHGGMSTVYLAEQESLGRKVALKVMLAEALADEVSRARFENEARTIARLEHPNIVGIFEVGRTQDDLPFYSMPHLSHGHLGQRKLAGDQPKVAAILRSLLQALDYAHVRGVVHRDVKAENVLFDDADRPMLADFGIALRRGSNPRLTHAGLAVGSTAYMPPEQARGQDVDRRADLYSIGVLTWEMLIGQLPYNAGDALSMALKHVQEPIPRLPSALKHWQPFIDKAMAKKPEQRFTSANDMVTALEALERQSGKVFAAVEIPANFNMQATPTSRHWLRPVLVAGAALMATGVLWMGASFFRPSPFLAKPTPAAAPTLAAAAATVTPPPLDDNASAPIAASDLGLDAYLANAQQQLRAGQLLAPPNANAWDSTDAAWRINPTNPETLHLMAQLFDALSLSAERALRNDDATAAKQSFQRAQALDTRRGGTGVAITLLRKRLDAALDDRVTLLLAKPASRPAASRLFAATVPWLGLDAARQRNLQTRITAIAGNPSAVAAKTNAPDSTPTAVAGALDLVTVNREDYARFARGIGRTAAECGKGFFGRTLRWDNTGSARRPVVCVSADDALAYAAWLGAQDGHRYRLPSAGELRTQPPGPAAIWLSLCADHTCSQRMTSSKPQALDASRGYSDVSIALARMQ